MKIDLTGIETDIGVELARRSHAGISFSPEKRGDAIRADYETELRELAAHIEKEATDPRQEEIAQAVFDGLRSRYRELTIAWLSAKSRCISTMITGGSKFPVHRANKANNAEHKRASELVNFSKCMKHFSEKYLAKVFTLEEKQGGEIEELRAKLTKAERYQDFMKATNAEQRKGGEGLVKLFADYYGVKGEEMLRHFQKANYMGNVGFERWQLSNNLANIKRMRERLQVLEERADKTANAEAEEESMNGLTIVKNHALQRLQLLFDGKPPEEVRAVLKSNGFKWSPTNSAWQRQITPNAEYALKNFILKNAVFDQYK